MDTLQSKIIAIIRHGAFYDGALTELGKGQLRYALNRTLRYKNGVAEITEELKMVIFSSTAKQAEESAKYLQELNGTGEIILCPELWDYEADSMDKYLFNLSENEMAIAVSHMEDVPKYLREWTPKFTNSLGGTRDRFGNGEGGIIYFRKGRYGMDYLLH